MRLTAELINNSLSYLNPLKERELDLRGHRIPAIENLGAAGPHDAIDFTDNDIQVLGNFPLSPRISTLLLAHNRIAAIQPSLPTAIPNLRNLVLTSNNLSELSDLEVLAGFPRLTHLVLIDNPATKKEVRHCLDASTNPLENYRYWVLARCPSVRFLDYQKVKLAERVHATELFGTVQEPTELGKQIMGIKSKTFDVMTSSNAATGANSSKLSRLKLTDKERQKLQDLIKKATSLEEIIRLEKALNEGRLPAGIIVDGDDDVDAMEE
ncbi:leucine-rich repeat-domain-containing protein [Podospora didyma]|uniref:U2 small nuclear ribonucleoprotein A' n=1 Tax=Podospora didyma TaxID=330526 RepID=A0AAE0U4S8_9PEZI|nr:leucine-rich repeat-domain-containing protein [Podospora didyma]